ncbi:site-specific recombinase, DNA invertase, putative Pin (plasmid) [Leifsonia sp. P73]
MDYLRAGDVLLVRRLDRLGGTERILIETLHELEDKGVDIKSLTEPVIDTTSPMGRALFGIVAVFAQLRVDTIRENTRLGLEYARAQGRVGGRPTVMTPERIEAARQMRAQTPRPRGRRSPRLSASVRPPSGVLFPWPRTDTALAVSSFPTEPIGEDVRARAIRRCMLSSLWRARLSEG